MGVRIDHDVDSIAELDAEARGYLYGYATFVKYKAMLNDSVKDLVPTDCRGDITFVLERKHPDLGKHYIVTLYKGTELNSTFWGGGEADLRRWVSRCTVEVVKVADMDLSAVLELESLAEHEWELDKVRKAMIEWRIRNG